MAPHHSCFGFGRKSFRVKTYVALASSPDGMYTTAVSRRFWVCGGISSWLGRDWARAGGGGAGIVGA